MFHILIILQKKKILPQKRKNTANLDKILDNSKFFAVIYVKGQK